MKPTDNDLSLLRAINVSGAVTVREIEKQFPALGKCDLACTRMFDGGYLERDWMGHGKPFIFTVSNKGRRLLHVVVAAPKGEMPGPKYAPSGEPYVPKSITTRPGADDHLRCLSRRGDDFIEHRGPISLAGIA